MRNVLSGLCFYDHATDAQEPYCLARTHHRTGGGEGERERGREGGRQRDRETQRERERETERELSLFLCLSLSVHLKTRWYRRNKL